MRELLQQHATAIVLGAFGLAIVLIILAITAGVRRTKRRKAEIREWAFRSGFDYQEGPMPASELAPLPHFTVEGDTTTADATNVVRGSRGVPVVLLDLQHTTCQRSGSHGNRTVHTTKWSTCALFKSPDNLPSFSFNALSASGPDTLQGKLLGGVVSMAKAVGRTKVGDAISIDNRPGFLLLSHDPASVRPLFADGKALFFDDKCGWTVESDHGWLLVTCDPAIYGHGWPRYGVIDAPQYDEFIRIATSIREHLAPERDGEWGGRP